MVKELLIAQYTMYAVVIKVKSLTRLGTTAFLEVS